ncbi:MAG: GSCFA domain-containing protein [Chitinophagaceae bacterium]|nr:GSCFA domain-containing protein [Chitinophagaceae bacterium]
MDFRLPFKVAPFSKTISHKHSIFLTGSCFTEHMSNYLAEAKFSVLENLHGILFNPHSIASSLLAYIENKTYTRNDLFHYNESWHSWEHHSRFSHPDPEEALHTINQSQRAAHLFLQKAGWLIITLGSAWIYELKKDDPDGAEHTIVANCHKVPAGRFLKRLMSTEDVLSGLGNMLYRLFIFNPSIRIIFTISPVRHLRDGFVENNKSKAVLIQAVHRLVEKFEQLFYFPAYELVIDDLRDYRFYAEDMVHPNYLATDYVWEQFRSACIDPSSLPLIKEMEKINLALRHRPFNHSSQAHQKFLQANLKKVKELQTEYPYLDFTKERMYFEK